MQTFGAYPKIWNLGHPAIKEIFSEPVLVEEKIDGSQFSFGVFDDGLHFYSKNQRVYPEVAGMFKQGVEAILSLEKQLTPGYMYRGEYLQKPKHNALAYSRTPTNHVVLFDVQPEPHHFLSRDRKVDLACRLGLEFVPSFQVDVKDMASIQEIMKNVSMLGGQKMEGLVFKNYERFGKDGKPLFAKYVSEAFREVHKGEWKLANPQKKDIVQTVIDKYRTPSRWHKAVQHLREAGTLTDSPKDIGALIAETQRDVFEECGEEIKEALYNWAKRAIGSGVSSGIPQWYKKVLEDNQFEEASCEK